LALEALQQLVFMMLYEHSLEELKTICQAYDMRVALSSSNKKDISNAIIRSLEAKVTKGGNMYSIILTI
jgi:hypothetical protein